MKKNIILAAALFLAAGFLVWLVYEKGRYAHMGEELASAKRQLVKNDRDLSGLRRNLTRLQADNARLAAEAGRFENDYNAARRNLTLLQSERDAFKRKLDDEESLRQIRQRESAPDLKDDSLAASRAAVAEKRPEKVGQPGQEIKSSGEAPVQFATKIEDIDQPGSLTVETEYWRREALAARASLAVCGANAQKPRNDLTMETEYWRREAQAARASLAESSGKIKEMKLEAVRETEELSAAREEIERLKAESTRLNLGGDEISPGARR